jgi:hypothetical protein
MTLLDFDFEIPLAVLCVGGGWHAAINLTQITRILQSHPSILDDNSSLPVYFILK